MDRRVVKTREAIARAYVQMLTEPATKLTIAELTRRANIDRKTFYLHYDGMDALLHAFSAQKVRELVELLRESAFFDRPFDAERFFQAFNEVASRDIELYRALSRRQDSQFFWNCLEETLLQTMTEIYFPRLCVQPDEFHVYAKLYVSGVFAVFRGWLRQEYDLSAEKLGTLLGKAVYEGLHAPFATHSRDVE